METLRYLGFLAVCALGAVLIIFVGWDEPIRYRFMSPVAIAAEESALIPLREMPPPEDPVEPAPAGNRREFGSSRLDRHEGR